MLYGRHGLCWLFWCLNIFYCYHLCDHPMSLCCKAYETEYSSLKVALSRFNFPFFFSYPSPPGVSSVLTSSCVLSSHAHLLPRCCDSHSFHIPLKAPYFGADHGSCPTLTKHENRESDAYPGNSYRSLRMNYL